MTMDDVERLIALFERSRLTEIEFSDGGTRVRIARREGGSRDDRPETPAGATPTERAGAVQATRTGAPDHLIVAGIVGTFFRAPAPGQRPFVSEGDVVEEGQTMAILEAMKMLNPVEADRPGRILRILVEDGVAVEAGTPLFVLAPAG